MNPFPAFAKSMLPILLSFGLIACGDHSGHGDSHKTQQDDTEALQAVVEGDIALIGAWARAAKPPQKTSAAYMKILNSGAEDDTLLSVSSDVAEFTEVHQSLKEDGVSLMRRIKALEIPAGETIELVPGGYHVMLINLTAPIEEGSTLPLTFEFEKAGTIVLEAQIKSMQGGDHHGHH